MSLRNFIFGLSLTFGFARVFGVIVPFFKMHNLPSVPATEEPDSAAFYPKRTGRVADGSRIYGENGCYLCHTQVIRPTYAGNDLFRPDWGGLAADPDRGDTRRETNAYDFLYEKVAHIGVTRMGPDLSNVGLRVGSLYNPPQGPAGWFYAHLYNPRYEVDRTKSTCPSFRFMFKEQKIGAARSADAVRFSDGTYAGDDTTEIIPGSDAEALVSYLMNLKKDHPAPPSLNFAPAKKDAK